MNWSLLLLYFLLLIVVVETPQLIKLRSAKDVVVFLGVWAVAMAASIADLAEWPQLRPLDWVRGVMQIFTG